MGAVRELHLIIGLIPIGDGPMVELYSLELKAQYSHHNSDGIQPCKEQRSTCIPLFRVLAPVDLAE